MFIKIWAIFYPVRLFHPVHLLILGDFNPVRLFQPVQLLETAEYVGTLLLKYNYDYLDKQSSRQGRAGVEFQTCMLESLMLYPLALSMPIFNKKSYPTRAVESPKLCIVVTNIEQIN